MLCVCATCALALPAQQNDAPDTQPTLTFSQFTAQKPIWMIAYGDMRFTDPKRTEGTNPRVRKWLAEKVGALHPEVLLLTGDMPFTGANYFDLEVFKSETASWKANKVLTLPTLGNHEIYGGLKPGVANYLKNFPEINGKRYYSALLGSVEVIALDSTEASGPATPQGKWFAAQMAHLPNQVQFLFILYHVPWVADRQSEMLINLPTKEALFLRDTLEANLEKLHARVIVFNGHIHNYERFERLGVEYVITGGGGAEPYPLLFRGKGDLYQDPGFPVYHYLTLEVSDRKVHVVMWKVKDPEAAELSVEQKDEFTLTLAPSAAPAVRPAASR